MENIPLFINLILYIYFISMYYDSKEKIFGLLQFGLMIPLTTLIAEFSYSNNIYMGWLIVFVIPMLSSIIVLDKYFNKKE